MTQNTNAVELKNVSCVFSTNRNQVRAVDDVSLEVLAGEFFSMLGPSGSGKTTCLRLIGGFEAPNAGEIIIFGQNASGQPPYARDVNTVFQDYALFPHMNVRDNVAYALMVRGVPKQERSKQSEAMLERVGLNGFGSRKPGQLSGGQRQRVALARALINQPKLLLLDEPLGALDLKLREEMQIELKSLQRSLGITFIYVTHDQSEALSMSDRVAVFNKGKIEQLDTPQKLYEHPRTEFVARFVGNANVLSANVLSANVLNTSVLNKNLIDHNNPNQTFALRPERIRLSDKMNTSNANEMNLTGTLLDIHFLGAQTRFEINLGKQRITTLGEPNPNLKIGQTVYLNFDSHALRALDQT